MTHLPSLQSLPDPHTAFPLSAAPPTALSRLRVQIHMHDFAEVESCSSLFPRCAMGLGLPCKHQGWLWWTGRLFIHCSCGCLEVQRPLEISKFGQTVRVVEGAFMLKIPAQVWAGSRTLRAGKVGKAQWQRFRALHKASTLGPNPQALGHTGSAVVLSPVTRAQL